MSTCQVCSFGHKSWDGGQKVTVKHIVKTEDFLMGGGGKESCSTFGLNFSIFYIVGETPV